MKNKEFDCVEMQRNIRDAFWNEAKGNLDNLNKIIDRELNKSELYRLLLERKEQRLKTA